MPTRITIKDLRHIKHLEFIVPKEGVWLLTGGNGTGKTSLLGCVRRIGYKNAFPVHFPASRKSSQLDSYEGATVMYESAGTTVAYTYRTERWVPTPKANSDLLSNLGYPDVVYVAANAERIEPNKDDFSPKRIKPAPASVIDGANQIFSTTKFGTLKTINVRKGVGSQAFLLQVPDAGTKKRYFSEKNLSLGELCIVKLLRKLATCARGSLVLIDELELALHPTAQAELLRYLQAVAAEKALTVLVSTHSATLIKQAPRNRVLFLQDDGRGIVECLTGCFPSYILGALAYREEAASDLVLYVEDDCARYLVEQFLRRTIDVVHPNNSLAPTFNVIPVGGITNVLRFFVRQRPLLPAISKAYVVLDGDAQASVANASAEDIVRIARQEAQLISYLPYTPEVGLVEFLRGERVRIRESLRRHFSLNTLALAANDIPIGPGAADPKPRKTCKSIVDQVCISLADQLPNASADDVLVILFKLLADHTFNADRAAVLRQFGPIVRR